MEPRVPFKRHYNVVEVVNCFWREVLEAALGPERMGEKVVSE